MKIITSRCLATKKPLRFLFLFWQNKSVLYVCACLPMSVNVCVGTQTSNPPFLIQCLCLCRCVFKSSRVCVPSPALQLVSLTDPSCNGDISAPVLAGEEEGGGRVGGVRWLSNALRVVWSGPGEPRLIFSKKKKPSKLSRRGGVTQGCRGGVAGRGCTANSNPLSLGHRADCTVGYGSGRKVTVV